MAQPRNPPKPDDQRDSYPRRLVDLLERNYAMMHRLQIGHAVLEAEVRLLRDPLFESGGLMTTGFKADR